MRLWNWRRRWGRAGWHWCAKDSRMQNRDGGLWPAEPATRVCPWTSRASRQDKAHARQAGPPGHRCRFGNPAAVMNVVPARRVAGRAQRRKEPTRNGSGCLFAATFPCQPALVPSNRPRSFSGTHEGPLPGTLLQRNRRPLQEEQVRQQLLAAPARTCREPRIEIELNGLPRRGPNSAPTIYS